MWLSLAALLIIKSAADPLTQLNDQLTAESEADSKVTEDVKCWCKELQQHFDTRIRESSAEMEHLEHMRNAKFYENQGLEVEIKQHKDQMASHTESLNAANSLAAGSSDSHSEEKEETQKALNSLRKAIEKVPEGSEVHGTLRGLEDKFASKLDEANADHERQQSNYKDAIATKKEMLRLAKEGAESKTRRLADGRVVVAQAKSQISALGAQKDADYDSTVALKSLCGSVEDAAADRESKRQATLVALSQAKADAAQKAAMRASSKVLLLKRSASVADSASGSLCSKALEILGASFKGDCSAALERAEDADRFAHDALNAAKKSAADLFNIIDKSAGLQREMSKVLSNIMLHSHLAASKGKLEDAVETRVSAMTTTADEDLKALPALFDEVRAKVKASNLADQKLVTSLMAGAAAASKALVEAKQCK